MDLNLVMFIEELKNYVLQPVVEKEPERTPTFRLIKHWIQHSWLSHIVKKLRT